MSDAGLPWVELPRFDRPPVVEIAIAVEFAPLPQLGVVELVKLHQAWEADFPLIVEQPPLPPNPPIEGTALQGFTLQIGGGFSQPVRLWMLTPDEHLLVQVQNDRLVMNWRKLAGETPYPSYDVLRGQFRERWDSFVALVGQRFGVRPTVAEVTFVNLIEESAGVADPSSWLASARPVPVPNFAELTQVRAQYVSTVRDGNSSPGQLVVTVEPTPGGASLTVVTRMSLGGAAPDTDRILDAMERAHGTCVLGFTDITTEEMHATWGRTR